MAEQIQYHLLLRIVISKNLAWETFYQGEKLSTKVGNFLKFFLTPQSLVAVGFKAIGEKMRNFFVSFFSLTQYFFVLQNLFIKKVSHFLTNGLEPYSHKGLRGEKLFKILSHLTKSFSPLTIGMPAIILDTVGAKHGLDKAVRMRNDFTVRKKFLTLTKRIPARWYEYHQKNK